MNKLFAAFDDFFGGGSSYDPSPQSSSSSQVTVTAYSQPHVLQTRMKEEKMSHGGSVTANLSPIRLDMDKGNVVMYFCPMKKLEILDVISEGDGNNIPANVKIEGLSIPSDFKAGFYELENIELTSNGTIQVKATERTSWKFIEEEALGY